MNDPATATGQELDLLCVNTVRTLAMDAVQQANSGHPGTPMALAPLCYRLFTHHMKHNPADPAWPDRDRFVLSCGHASMLLYAALYLAGYDLTLEDLKQFRQWGSKTPGHPEFGLTPGVETTTGPLGQGLANAVGMGIAERHLAAVFNRPGHRLVDHVTFFIASDGDLMEGISHEAASYAGHLGLGKLIGFFDDNRITIDGDTSLTCGDDVARRFEAYGWHVGRIDDVNDLEAIDRAVLEARGETSRPSLIVVRTHIGYGSPHKQDTAAAHGSPLGEDEVKLTKQHLGWPWEEPFYVPEEALAEWRKCRKRGEEAERAWREIENTYAGKFPGEHQEWLRRLKRRLPESWSDSLPNYTPENGNVATREASGNVVNSLSRSLPELMGGSADLSGSVKTVMQDEAPLSRKHPENRNMYFGIREHAMGGIMNGMALHGGVRPYGGTFLVFSDYMRPSIRLAALMQLPVIYLFSHDSIGLGEDGPTHQPVEMLATLRTIPGLTVLRPADAAEAVEAWKTALVLDGPAAIVLTRQKTPFLNRRELAAQGEADELGRGGYVVAGADLGEPRLTLIATGSEVGLAVEAWKLLVAEGINARVVSMPSLELFMAQPVEYRETVVPPGSRRLIVEAAHPMTWYQLAGDSGEIVGVDRFGASAPYQRLYEEFGITAADIVRRARALLG